MNSRLIHLLIIWFTLLKLTSCIDGQDPDESSSLIDAGSGTTYILEGDLVVTNYSSDSAILLDSDGNFKDLLYNVENNQEQVVGVNWNAQTSEVILSINGYPDRIVGISAADGTQRTVVQTNQLNGNTFGVAVSSAGEYWAIESHQIEKFDVSGNRINDGIFPTGTLFTNLAQINSTSSGGFVVCGYGGDQVATYDSLANQLNTTVSGIASTTNGYGCDGNSSGEVVASWDGTTDSVVIYNNSLDTVLATFSDTTIMPSPRGIEIKANGNILVTDISYHYIIELEYDSSAGTLSFVRNIGGGLLNYPWQVIEIPELDL
jgi:hypothetical protein